MALVKLLAFALVTRGYASASESRGTRAEQIPVVVHREPLGQHGRHLRADDDDTQRYCICGGTNYTLTVADLRQISPTVSTNYFPYLGSSTNCDCNAQSPSSCTLTRRCYGGCGDCCDPTYNAGNPPCCPATPNWYPNCIQNRSSTPTPPTPTPVARLPPPPPQVPTPAARPPPPPPAPGPANFRPPPPAPGPTNFRPPPPPGFVTITAPPPRQPQPPPPQLLPPPPPAPPGTAASATRYCICGGTNLTLTRGSLPSSVFGSSSTTLYQYRDSTICDCDKGDSRCQARSLCPSNCGDCCNSTYNAAYSACCPAAPSFYPFCAQNSTSAPRTAPGSAPRPSSAPPPAPRPSSAPPLAPRAPIVPPLRAPAPFLSLPRPPVVPPVPAPAPFLSLPRPPVTPPSPAPAPFLSLPRPPVVPPVPVPAPSMQLTMLPTSMPTPRAPPPTTAASDPRFCICGGTNLTLTAANLRITGPENAVTSYFPYTGSSTCECTAQSPANCRSLKLCRDNCGDCCNAVYNDADPICCPAAPQWYPQCSQNASAPSG